MLLRFLQIEIPPVSLPTSVSNRFKGITVQRYKNIIMCVFLIIFFFPFLLVTYFLLIQVVNFKLIPVAHQLNFCLAVSLVWATILSVIRAPDSSSLRKLEEVEPACAEVLPVSHLPVDGAQ